jgi:hypothetical protein
MFVVHIEHAVQDFDKWKAAFDSNPLGRQRSGVRRYQVLRPTDDPKYVMIDLEFDDRGKAEAFQQALRNMWDNPEAQKVVQSPKVRLAEAVETREF